MSSEVVNVRVRVLNKVYAIKVSPRGVTDILINGLNSRIIQTIQKGKHESVVVGEFRNPVEILSAVNQTEMSAGVTPPADGTMEIEITAAATNDGKMLKVYC